ncbi:hypothetical protein AHF37_00994 [Paragonimus kellicotti]|nr:hypothetical protein AHF37_00994 [Paragonimus kellicotti]
MDNLSLDAADPQLERQVEIIRNLVESYMKIVHKTQRDLVPKLLMHMLVNEQMDNLSLDAADPQLERQVEIIRNLVESYMKIVHKTQRDLVPKLLMHMLVNEQMDNLSLDAADPQLERQVEIIRNLVESYMKIVHKTQRDLVPKTTHAYNTLMTESLGTQQKREEMVRVYDAMKEALGIISEVSMSTVSTPLPPPVIDDWQQIDSNLTLSGGLVGPPPPSPVGNRRPPPPPPGGAIGAKVLTPSVVSRPAPSVPGRTAAAPNAQMPSPLVPQ